MYGAEGVEDRIEQRRAVVRSFQVQQVKGIVTVGFAQDSNVIAGQLHLYSAADGDVVYCHGITGQNIGAFHRRAAAFQAVFFQEAVVVDIAVEPLSQIDVPALRVLGCLSS